MAAFRVVLHRRFNVHGRGPFGHGRCGDERSPVGEMKRLGHAQTNVAVDP